MPSWSPLLHNTIALALHTRFPVALFWGPGFTTLYNEAFVPLIADKHPSALGEPAALLPLPPVPVERTRRSHHVVEQVGRRDGRARRAQDADLER